MDSDPAGPPPVPPVPAPSGRRGSLARRRGSVGEAALSPEEAAKLERELGRLKQEALARARAAWALADSDRDRDNRDRHGDDIIDRDSDDAAAVSRTPSRTPPERPLPEPAAAEKTAGNSAAEEEEEAKQRARSGMGPKAASRWSFAPAAPVQAPVRPLRVLSVWASASAALAATAPPAAPPSPGCIRTSVDKTMSARYGPVVIASLTPLEGTPSSTPPRRAGADETFQVKRSGLGPDGAAAAEHGAMVINVSARRRRASICGSQSPAEGGYPSPQQPSPPAAAAPAFQMPPLPPPGPRPFRPAAAAAGEDSELDPPPADGEHEATADAPSHHRRLSSGWVRARAAVHLLIEVQKERRERWRKEVLRAAGVQPDAKSATAAGDSPRSRSAEGSADGGDDGVAGSSADGDGASDAFGSPGGSSAGDAPARSPAWSPALQSSAALRMPRCATSPVLMSSLTGPASGPQSLRPAALHMLRSPSCGGLLTVMGALAPATPTAPPCGALAWYKSKSPSASSTSPMSPLDYHRMAAFQERPLVLAAAAGRGAAAPGRAGPGARSPSSSGPLRLAPRMAQEEGPAPGGAAAKYVVPAPGTPPALRRVPSFDSQQGAAGTGPPPSPAARSRWSCDFPSASGSDMEALHGSGGRGTVSFDGRDSIDEDGAHVITGSAVAFFAPKHADERLRLQRRWSMAGN